MSYVKSLNDFEPFDDFGITLAEQPDHVLYLKHGTGFQGRGTAARACVSALSAHPLLGPTATCL